jgi:hypothetical protein
VHDSVGNAAVTAAAFSADSRFRPDVSKNSSDAFSSKAGEFERSMITLAPARASARPSPVMVLTPVFGAAATTSWSFLRSRSTVFEPMRPVPPITTIFMFVPPCSVGRMLAISL